MENAPIFDTHAHYDDPQFDPDREQLLRRLPDQGVVGVVSCGCDLRRHRLRFAPAADCPVGGAGQ